MAPLPTPGGDISTSSGALPALQNEITELRRELALQREQNEQLRQQLRECHQSVGMFVYCFHNALPPIRVAVENLAHPERDEESRSRASSMARRQLDHLRRLMRELRESYQVTYDQLTLDCGAVAVVPTLLAALRPYHGLCAAKGQHLEVSVPADTLVVWADPSRFVQIIAHLLDNAVRCIPAGGRISVEVESQYGEVVIQVQDTGMGMSPDQLADLTARFAPRDPYAGPLPSGLASSLSIVHGLMRLHRGTFEAQSAGHGLGCMFTLRFPRHDPDRTAAATA